MLAGRFYVSEIVSNVPLLRVNPITGATTKLFDTGLDLIHGLETAPAPAIRPSASFQPTAVFRDRRASFTASATGIAPLAYQWRRDGQGLPGQTNKTLTITSAQPADEGDYTVEVSNLGGSTISPPARLWVVPPASEFQKHNFTNAANVRLPYFVHLPSNYDPSRRYPLMVVTHGSGWHEGLLPAGFWEYPQVLVFASYAQQARDPVILVYPTHRSELGGSAWSLPEADLIAGLLDDLATQLPVDSNRVYLLSVTVSFEVAVRVATLRRDGLAAAALAYGYVRPNPVLKGLPLWIFYSLQEGTGAKRFAETCVL